MEHIKDQDLPEKHIKLSKHEKAALKKVFVMEYKIAELKSQLEQFIGDLHSECNSAYIKVCKLSHKNPMRKKNRGFVTLITAERAIQAEQTFRLPSIVKSAVRRINDTIINRWNGSYQPTQYKLNSWFDIVAAFSPELFKRLWNLYMGRCIGGWIDYLTFESETLASKGIFNIRRPSTYIHKQAPITVGKDDIPF
ncbi:hypothetical protein [Pseudoalteromonas luteoviolacea]|uniref:hypothetical protein n=1 Tax=Pseudoalteromonas luteoviolacea TaxID=43657 RepID=UPI001154901E|nr:hypothetical protein [Pseudoalteromonas luteoviolacea]TQF70477.1 hypothetical protein FLM44_05115 [Pseudoalteromonas luteoviolacea]